MRLFIAEKPSLARAIASGLGKGKSNDGYIKIDGKDDIVTWCFGHILTQYEPQEYDEKFKSWNVLPIFPKEWKLNDCKAFRENSKQKQAHQSAETPHLFASDRQPSSEYLLVPIVSSEKRIYIPIGYMDNESIASNACFMIPNATTYIFGILNSNIHMHWMRTVAGRLKSDYRYSNTIVYNNFPWCNPTAKQKVKIEMTAQAIIDARSLYPNSSLADLYDERTMPKELRKAHQDNDKAVMEAYGFYKDGKWFSPTETVSALMKMYQELVAKEK